ncbi:MULTISPECIES: biopolymer transporter ExbD [Chitinivorax]|uniref:Biopolymer transport protein ExbD n=1 Tax=Chitinivorax tropicus TaxID=714531 RepID=A0A840MTJ4_9PROT|nr:MULTISPECIES: biopolymer transporter ExbD [Chitinivorax]MBB5020112.1 biopolymer transport protein ExbD [Chitinivorax tropicus]
MRAGRYLEHKEARIEVIPLIDIMMFLLIFFMVVTLKMMEGAGITLQLPSSKTATTMQPPVKVAVGVKEDGSILVDNQAHTHESLTALLKQKKASAPKVEVIIAGDKTTSLQTLMSVMDDVRAAGITAVGIATKKEAGGA